MYRYIRQRLETLEGLQGKVFPVTAMIDNVDGAFAVYTGTPPTAEQDLDGEVHHYVERYTVDFIGPLYDEVISLYWKAVAALSAYNLDTGLGAYIFSAVCMGAGQEQFDPDAGLYRVPMQVEIRWCPGDA